MWVSMWYKNTGKKSPCNNKGFSIFGGSGEIRTHGGGKPSSVFKLLGLTLYWALLTFSKPYIPLQNNALKLYFVLCSLFMLSLYRLQIAYGLQCKKGKRLRQ